MKPDIRTIEPAPGRRVRSPDKRLITGATDVIWSSYWARLLRDGDVVIVEPSDEPGEGKPAAKAPAASPPTPPPATPPIVAAPKES